MAKFTKNKDVEVSASTSVDVEIDISVEDFYDEMSDSEEKEMIDLLRYHDVSISELMDTVDDKAKFYKDLAYHVGASDVEHLDALITELQYWSKKWKS